MKKHFNKELVVTKEDNVDVENSTKCWICGYDYIDSVFRKRTTLFNFKQDMFRE